MSDCYDDDSDDESNSNDGRVFDKDVVKNVQEPVVQRTRSGRVTRPPNNLEPRHGPGRQARSNILDAGVDFS